MVQVTVAVAIVELGLLGLIIREVLYPFSFSFSHRFFLIYLIIDIRFLENVVDVSRIICINIQSSIFQIQYPRCHRKDSVQAKNSL